MLTRGAATRVIIHVNEDTSAATNFLHTEIFQFLFEKGIAGATMIRPHAGFGSHHQLHVAGGESVEGEHLPIRIEFLDTPETVDAILPALCDLITDGLIETQPTTVVKAAQRPQRF